MYHDAIGGDDEPMLEPGGSWRAVFDGFGFASAAADGREALADVLTGWESASGPLFVELPMDPEAYQEMLRGIR